MIEVHQVDGKVREGISTTATQKEYKRISYSSFGNHSVSFIAFTASCPYHNLFLGNVSQSQGRWLLANVKPEN